jgi:fumarylacetoacetase
MNDREVTDCWVNGGEAGAGFGIDNLPLGVFVPGPGAVPRVGTRIAGSVLDLAAASSRLAPEREELFAQRSLNRFLAAGRPVWREVRSMLQRWLSQENYRSVVEPALHDIGDVSMLLPIEVADYVDFYASEHHARKVGQIFRPDSDPLPASWKHLPIGYHGRAGSVVVSGTPVARPRGLSGSDGHAPRFGPSTRLDIEAEVGFVVGMSSAPGTAVPMSAFTDAVFGACLVNDWSARDIQAYEYVPLGPFLGKSFATSMSAWVVALDALQAARVDPPRRDQPLAPYLADAGQRWGLDLRLTVRLNGEVISEPPFSSMYWTAAQQLAHMTVNGAPLRPGDLYASGTVSGGGPRKRGSMLGLTWNGQDPLRLADGTMRGFLEDGDEVAITARAPSVAGHIEFGEVTGCILAQVNTTAGPALVPARHKTGELR